MSELFLFAGLPFHARLRVSRICQELFFEPGQHVVKEGSIRDALYVIVQGQVRVTRAGVDLARLGSGEHFGELGLLEDQQRSASVTGASYGSAIVIRRAQLQEFCQREPALGNQILWRLMHTLGGRLREANSRAAKFALERS
jgi:cAMP-binding proteins - catabolite gene activator and regulatory subunit of cAMP-dependent protein kinases